MARARNVDPIAACPSRPAAGSEVLDPPQLSSAHGELRVVFDYRRSVGSDGQVHYCYLTPEGMQNPTLRLQRGDWLILRLRNDLTSASIADMPHRLSPCSAMAMGAAMTNLHFHGLSVPPRCHQDDVLHTAVGPGASAFEYRFQIPLDEPSGLYWYHPHVHGFSNTQVLGGASGALIVEGLAQAVPQVAGLAERVFVVRDQDLLHPDAAPVRSESIPPPMVMHDSDGDILNTGTGGGKPAKDLSLNFVPVAFPQYPPARIKMHLGERQLWRILNASAITYLDLQLLIDGQLQAFGVVALDGIALHTDGDPQQRILWQSHALIPPGGRVEVLVKAPAPGTKASLVTRTVDTGPAGENDPTRPLATLTADAAVPEAAPPRMSVRPLRATGAAWVGDVAAVRTRRLYFSEHAHDPQDPKSATDFFISVEGQEPKLFDPHAATPNIVVQQGDVEDWIIEKRTRELHAFHIHQIHFLLEEWNGVPVQEPYLRDTINVGYWDGTSDSYPSVKLRMDFRDPNAVGDFVYHCHLLEHEDGGMMGVIRVESPSPQRSHTGHVAVTGGP
jgi:FtsP/CotA-like multicopper oxidase with cupredoxin domain